MKHPNALYRARMKPRCSRASLRAARLALAMPGLVSVLNKAFAQQQATPAEVWREWIGPRLVRLRKQQLLEIARVKLLPGHIFDNSDGFLSGGAFLPTGAKK